MAAAERRGDGPRPGHGRSGELTTPRPHTRLHAGTPARARLDAAELHELVREVRRLPEGERPWCAGAVVLAGRGPVVAVEQAAGWAVRYAGYDAAADRGVELPRGAWEPMRTGTVFDLASLTKLCTAIVAVQQMERGVLEAGRPVAAYVPEFAVAGKADVTVRQLLTHTSGLRPELPFYERAGRAARLEMLWDEEPVAAPGSGRRYSDLNMIALQMVLERITGEGLGALVRTGITGPLGMSATGFRPVGTLPGGAGDGPAEVTGDGPTGAAGVGGGGVPGDGSAGAAGARGRAGVAATEDQSRPWAKADRGMLCGEVHDENAWAFGGVAGHAGLFSTAWDLAVLCRALLNAGTYEGARILAPASVDLLLAPPGLGFEVDQPWFMGELAGRGAAGHTGFTGTSLVLDRATDSFLVLLANTVHPRRRPADSVPRATAATRLARAVRAADDRDAAAGEG
ncbi:serine hydrolase domain-containing protein [Streptomyces sp. NPDC001922]|uniref:serine hydrolase domain-containing protein n=1 Tax=Streptomyces sp. NPDC001922 TaxID=3364624 RepID=UPI003685A35A